MTELWATISGLSTDIEDAILHGTMDEFEEYDNSYIQIHDGEVEIISSIPGESASTYADFSEEFFDEVSGDAEILIDIETFLFYLETSEPDNKSVTVNFHGQEDNQLASSVEILGSLDSRVYLPNSQQILEQTPLWLSDAFTDDENYSPGDKELETRIDTDASEIEKIINIVDAEQVRGINEYPLVVQDGELVLHAVDENSRSEVSGSLEAEIEGPDLANTYQTGFSEAFNSLWGDVTLRASPGGSPVAITKELDGGTIRDIIGHTGVV